MELINLTLANAKDFANNVQLFPNDKIIFFSDAPIFKMQTDQKRMDGSEITFHVVPCLLNGEPMLFSIKKMTQKDFVTGEIPKENNFFFTTEAKTFEKLKDVAFNVERIHVLKQLKFGSTSNETINKKVPVLIKTDLAKPIAFKEFETKFTKDTPII